MVGKGDPRGMLAAEGANNATITTDLVPTLLVRRAGRAGGRGLPRRAVRLRLSTPARASCR